MLQKSFDPLKAQLVFKNIHKGMTVYDSNNKKAGTVKDYYFGASSDEMEQHGVGAATAPDPSLRHDTLVDDVAKELFDKDNLPDEMRQRLINEGFIRIDSGGLFSSDRFAIADEIDHVGGENVYLNVPRDGLLRK